MASGVNDAGQVVGTASLPDGSQHAFRADVDGTLTDLGAFPDGTTSLAVGIDGAGRVAGRANRGDGNFRAFRYASGLVDLDSFAGFQSSAEGTSNGTTVGWYTMLPTFENHAFAHTVADGSFDLNARIPADSGWVLQQAKAVNATGQIIGSGLLNNEPRAFLLSLAVPPDTTAPTINSVSVTPATIVPPNKRMVPVTVAVNAIDDRDMAPACWVTHIDGHGAPAANFSVTGALSGSVRAVGGSTYSFYVTCADAAGNAGQAFANVVVPPDTTGPVFTNLSATPAMIWPPQNQMVPVAISTAAVDDSGDVPCLPPWVHHHQRRRSGDRLRRHRGEYRNGARGGRPNLHAERGLHGQLGEFELGIDAGFREAGYDGAGDQEPERHAVFHLAGEWQDGRDLGLGHRH